MKAFSPFFRSLSALTVVLLHLMAAVPLITHAAPGDLDSLDPAVVGSYVLATAVQPDGKTIIAGSFTTVLGQPRSYIARLNADGTLDTGFDPKASSAVFSIAVQADGKVLLGGNFTSLQPNGAAASTPRQYIARVNADGTLDASFDPRASSTVYSVAVQADGKILLGGGFTSLRPNGAASATPRQYIARVNADGTLDAGFDPRASSTVYSVAVQADGKVLLGGTFSSLQPNGAASATARQYIARVNADGTLDTGFDPKASSGVFSIAVQADGKILLGGGFGTLQPNGAASATARQYMARVNADGTLDAGFDPKPDNSVYCLAVQADGKVLLGGIFGTLQPNGAATSTLRQYIGRVNADGTLDAGFDPKASSYVYSVAVQADGKVLLGGLFSSLQPNGAASATPRNHFARLLNDPATQSLTAPDSTRVLWTRGGSSPEVSQVTFELSTDGGTSYTSLPGTVTRVGTTANWQLGSQSLPASGQLRARGRTTNGYQNGSAGLVESVASFTLAAAPAPTVTTINPSSGSTLGGTSVTITGTGFTGATGVTIGGTAATGLTVTNDTTITCTTPAGVAGTASVLVTTPGGTNSANTLYAYSTPPTVVATSPTVTVNESSQITNTLTANDVDGDNVVLTASVGTVTRNPQLFSDTTTGGKWRTSSVVKPQDVDGNNIYGTDGYGMWGLNGVETVVNPSYATIVRNPALAFFPGGPNFYTSIDNPANPAGAQVYTGVAYNSANPTTFCTITFTQARTVRMGVLVDNADFAAISPSTLRLQQTAGGTIDTGFLTAGTVATRDKSTDYYFFDIAAQPGDVYVLSGNNDSGHASNGIGGVFFDTGVASTGSNVWTWKYTPADGPATSNVTITATDARGAASTTTFALNVNNVSPTIALTGNNSVTRDQTYTLNLGAIIDPGTDTISSFAIDWGDGTAADTFSGVPSGSKTHTYAVSGSTTINVSLTDEDGTFAGGTKTLTVNAPVPTVTGVSPTSGIMGGSFSVTITGSGFTGATGVTVGGMAATSVNVVNDTTITCIVPAGTVGTASVLVTTSGGTNAANTLFTYVVPPPVITGNPGNQDVTVGQTASFSASATGTPAPSVQWQVSTNGGSTFNNIVGATTTTFVFTTALVNSTNKYRAVFTNDGGSVATSAATLTVYSRPVGIRPGFHTTTYGPSDDGSTGLVNFGFTINLFGTNYSACYVNNNGNLTFDGPKTTFSPDPIVNSALKIIAPFWGDVDTRGAGSGLLGYGTGTVNGHLAWGATWDHVGYYASKTDKLNTFQVVLIDRSDLAPGAFDIEFNYGSIQWQYGDSSIGAAPRAGYSNGSNVSYELTGSGVLGAFVDGGPNSLTASSGTLIFSSVSGVITPTTVTPDVTPSTAVQTTAVTTVTINGSGFATTNANNSVLFNLGAAGSVTSSSTTQLVVTFAVRPVAGNLMAVVTSGGISSGAAEQVATIVPPVIVTTAAVDSPRNTTPGTAIVGASWSSIRSGMVMSGSGALAYRGHMALSGGVTVDDFQGIWKSSDGSVAGTALVVRSGTTLEPSVGALFDILPFNPIINNAAQTSFIGMLRVNSGTPAVTTSSDSGVWSELGTGGLKKLLREGDTLSGSTVGTVAPSTWIAGSANAAAFGVKLGSGSALVRVDVAGSVATPSIVAAQGDTAPVKTGGDAGAFDTFVGNTSDPRMDAAGNVAFLNTVLPAGQGIWYKTVAGALTAVANTSQTAPGQGGPVFTGFERPSLSGDGSTIAFRAFLSGANGQSVFKGSVTAPVAIAKSNDTAITGVPAGRKLWSIWSPFTNNTGKVAFRVSLVDTATNANESRAILTDANGTLSVIAKVGDTAPGLGAQTFTNFDHPIIGDGNQCAFIGTTNAGTVGLFRQAAGGGPLVLVTMVGDVVTIAGGSTDTVSQIIVPGTASDDRKYESKAIDSAGHILLHVTYASGKTGIFLSAP